MLDSCGREVNIFVKQRDDLLSGKEPAPEACSIAAAATTAAGRSALRREQRSVAHSASAWESVYVRERVCVRESVCVKERESLCVRVCGRECV